MPEKLVEIIVRVDGTQAERMLKTLGGTAETTSHRMTRAFERGGMAAQSLGRVMMGVGATMAAVGYASVKSAMTFETAMTRIHSQAQVSTKGVAQLSKEVLDLGASGKVQYGPTQLANALYHIQSVAVGNTIPGLQKTGAAMNVLRISAQGAAVGGSDLEATTSALMGVMYAIHAPASQAQGVMALINATVGAGNMRMEDLVTALGRGVVPAFVEVGLKASDAFAGLALFADQGTKASSSAAQVATALHYLVVPSRQAQKALAGLHMTQGQMNLDLSKPNGFLTALKDLKSHLDKYAGGGTTPLGRATIMSIFPGGRGRIMEQAISNLTQYGDKLKALENPLVSFQEGVAAQQRTLSGQLHTAWAKIQTDMTKFGGKLIPIISDYLPKFVHVIGSAFGWLTHLSKGTQEWLVRLTFLFLTIGGSLFILGKFLTMMSTLQRLFMVLGGGRAAAGITAVGNAAVGATPKIAGANAALGTTVAEERAAAAGLIGKGGLIAALAAITTYFGYKQLSKPHQKQAKEAGGDVLHFLTGNLLPHVALPIALGKMVNQFMGGHVGRGAMELWKHTPFDYLTHPLGIGHTGGLVTGSGIQHYATGGLVGTGADNQLAMLQTGEGVLNRAAMANLGVGGLSMANAGRGFGEHSLTITPSPAYFVVDGRVLARAVVAYTLQRGARGPSSLSGGAMVTGTTSLTTSGRS